MYDIVHNDLCTCSLFSVIIIYCHFVFFNLFTSSRDKIVYIGNRIVWIIWKLLFNLFAYYPTCFTYLGSSCLFHVTGLVITIIYAQWFCRINLLIIQVNCQILLSKVLHALIWAIPFKKKNLYNNVYALNI